VAVAAPPDVVPSAGSRRRAEAPDRRRWAWWRSRQVLIAGPAVVLLLVAAALAPVVAPADPNALNPRAKAQPPSLAHVLGTDEFGRDLWSRLVRGARITLVVGLSSVALAAVLGTLLGRG
jgi:peptide/nickel transport system permease protein